MNSCVSFLDGVVLVDPDYLKDRKGTGPSSRGLRGGGEVGKRDGLALRGAPKRWRVEEEARSRIQATLMLLRRSSCC